MSDQPFPADALPAPKNKPWRVTAYRTHPRYGVVWKCFLVGDYRWYWQANIVSFIYHHLFEYGCNTWKRKET